MERYIRLSVAGLPTSNLNNSPPDLHMYQFCNYEHVCPKIEKVSFTSLRTENDCKIWDCLNFPGQKGNKSNTEKGQNPKFQPK